MLQKYKQLVFGFSLGFIIAHKKLQYYPSYLYKTYTTLTNEGIHYRKYSSFYHQDPPQKKLNILMLNHGRNLGVPLFQDITGKQVDTEDCSFVTIHYEDSAWPHLTNKFLWEMDTYIRFLERFSDQHFDYIFVFHPKTGVFTQYNNMFYRKEFGKTLSRILKESGELLLEDVQNLEHNTHPRYDCLSFVKHGRVELESIDLTSEKSQSFNFHNYINNIPLPPLPKRVVEIIHYKINNLPSSEMA